MRLSVASTFDITLWGLGIRPSALLPHSSKRAPVAVSVKSNGHLSLAVGGPVGLLYIMKTTIIRMASALTIGVQLPQLQLAGHVYRYDGLFIL